MIFKENDSAIHLKISLTSPFLSDLTFSCQEEEEESKVIYPFWELPGKLPQDGQQCKC